MKKEQITGVILAGGKNSRMGSDKGLLEVEGKRIIERIIGELKQVVDEIIIISNSTSYNYLSCKVYSDIIKDCGPMGGIHAALTYSASSKNLIISCDMPFISKKTLQIIIERSSECEIAIPERDGELEPLCAVYSRSCLDKFEKLLTQSVTSSSPDDLIGTYRDVLDTTRSVSTRTDKPYKKGEFKLKDSLKHFKVKKINFTKKEISGNEFMNINTPEEYQFIKA